MPTFGVALIMAAKANRYRAESYLVISNFKPFIGAMYFAGDESGGVEGVHY